MATLRIRIDGSRLRGTLEIGGELIDFAGERLVLGRGEGCDIRVHGSSAGPSYALSRRHVELDHAKGEVRIRDLSSPQGIFLNRKHVPSETPTVIRDGDVVQIGVEDFQVRIDR